MHSPSHILAILILAGNTVVLYEVGGKSADLFIFTFWIRGGVSNS